MSFKDFMIYSVLILSFCTLLANSQYYDDEENFQPRLINYKNHVKDDLNGLPSAEEHSSNENGIMKRSDQKNSLSNQERKHILNKVNHLIKLLNQKKAM
jgi:hypothetical protein